ncbi:MAG: heavy metal translocating P-type ATPase metal-binding domain-containing protein [Myxococcota bacterium]
MARTSSDTLCAHCRAPLPNGSAGGAEGFCCSGCRTARELLTKAGLDHYYVLATGQGTPGEAAPSETTWLPALLEAARMRTPTPDRLTLEVDVQGLHCAACVWVLQALFKRLPGAHHLLVNPGVGRLRLTIDPERFPLEGYLADIARVGYRSGPPCREGKVLSDGLGVRLGVTIAIAMNAMAISLATYLGLGPDDPDGLYGLFGWVNLGLSTAAMIIASPVFVKGAWHALRRKTLHLDVPIALGVVLAWVGSVGLFLGGRPDLAYFDTLDVFLALMLLGRWSQRRLLDTNRRMLLDDDGFGHARVKLLGGNGALSHRPLSELQVGSRFLVAPGELVPVMADLEGASPVDCDLAWITGESEPVTFTPGARPIPAGAHLMASAAASPPVGAGSARVLVAREPFSASALHELLARTRGDEVPTDSFWHHLTTAWVVAVVAFAAITAIAWWQSSPVMAWHYATAVLVVTCPCAIGLATPLAYELAHLRLRKAGLLPRRPGLLDRARKIRHVVFDKTGTLTLTELEVVDAPALARLGDAERDTLWQLTARSNHPKSRALQAALPAGILDLEREVVEVAGKGLVSRDASGDRARDWALVSDGRDLVFSRGDTAIARIAFHEVLRPDARAEVARLTAAGLDVHIASGDANDRVDLVAAALDIPPERAHGGLSPERKAALVAELGAAETLVLGDGVNDALAFEAAALAGTPAIDRPTLPARADFVLVGRGLGPLAEMMALARRTRRITTRNLVIAAVYNLLGLSAGLAGWLSPVVASLAMPASSLLVIAVTVWSATRSSPAGDHVRVHDPLAKEAPVWMPST